MPANTPLLLDFDCADDLMKYALSSLVDSPNRFSATKGEGTEILGASLRLKNPRARLSRSEMRGKVYSALGELFWCLSGSNEISFIEHYIKKYSEFSDDGRTIHGAYGPRIFGKGECAQIENIISLLSKKRESRRAVVQIFSSADVLEDGKDIPCTCTLQVFIRGERLHLITHMRSNDAYIGLPHDIFLFTMLQEILARALKVDIGFYHHFVGHLHLYDADREKAKAFLSEGFQSIEPMPPMPDENPMQSLPELLEAEKAIRTDPESIPLCDFDPYWEDILRLIRIYSERRHRRDGFGTRVTAMINKMISPVYNVYFLS